MAIRYYDEALCDKIKNWVLDDNAKVLSPQDSTRLFSIMVDEAQDEPLSLPIITLSRDPTVEILVPVKKTLTYDGGHVDANTNNSILLDAIPIKISYQLDIYTRYFAEADEYARNFVFNFVNDPLLYINIPYNNANLSHRSTVLLENSISDNSDIPERLIRGQFTRMTLKLYIDDAYLFSVPIKQNWSVNTGIVELI